MKALLFASLIAFSFNAHGLTLPQAKAVIQSLAPKQNRTKEESVQLKLAIMRLAGAWAIAPE